MSSTALGPPAKVSKTTFLVRALDISRDTLLRFIHRHSRGPALEYRFAF